MKMNLKIIGIGGVGSYLAPVLCKFISNLDGSHTVTLQDGDSFEPKNKVRQNFNRYGNKAESKAQDLREEFPELRIEFQPHYVNAENIFLFINDGDIVFSCVDNHKTRKLISDYCESLDNIVFISGGNEYSDGNVQIHIRKDGKEIKPPITKCHPEIKNPQDRHPEELSCEELAAAGALQILPTNFRVVSDMLTTFWLYLEGRCRYSELYFDLATGYSRPVDRTNIADKFENE